jgi:hypothetical protein
MRKERVRNGILGANIEAHRALLVWFGILGSLKH